jgi:hypothetical protein
MFEFYAHFRHSASSSFYIALIKAVDILFPGPVRFAAYTNVHFHSPTRFAGTRMQCIHEYTLPYIVQREQGPISLNFKSVANSQYPSQIAQVCDGFKKLISLKSDVLKSFAGPSQAHRKWANLRLIFAGALE